MALRIVRNDITKMKVDAIVNTANEKPVYGEGVDTAVYKAAGEEELLARRREIGSINVGDVAITPGFRLAAKNIIHAVSPAYKDGAGGEEQLLRSCYAKSLRLAYEKGCESIAFPLISTGSYGYPKEEGMRIAIDEIHAFLLKHEMSVYLVVFDNQATRLGKNLYPDLEAYIEDNYVNHKMEDEYGYGGEKSACEGRRMPKSETMASRPMPMAERMVENMTEDGYDQFLEKCEGALQERLSHLSDTFQQYLMYFIENRGLTNSEVYKRAIITKQLFSKIKRNEDYHPDKGTAMRLCVGAKLNLDETKDLLARAGYALSPCDKRDIIFSYFIENEVYDMIEIDIVLEEHGLPCFID